MPFRLRRSVEFHQILTLLPLKLGEFVSHLVISYYPRKVEEDCFPFFLLGERSNVSNDSGSWINDAKSALEYVTLSGSKFPTNFSLKFDGLFTS